MAEPVTDPVITADDVIRAGACRSGVAARLQKLGKRVAAAMTVLPLPVGATSRRCR